MQFAKCIVLPSVVTKLWDCCTQGHSKLGWGIIPAEQGHAGKGMVLVHFGLVCDIIHQMCLVKLFISCY